MQEKVREFIEEYALSCNEKIRYIDLVSEIGELGKEILRQTDIQKIDMILFLYL